LIEGWVTIICPKRFKTADDQHIGARHPRLNHLRPTDKAKLHIAGQQSIDRPSGNVHGFHRQSVLGECPRLGTELDHNDA
jgi:hypothetical protein